MISFEVILETKFCINTPNDNNTQANNTTPPTYGINIITFIKIVPINADKYKFIFLKIISPKTIPDTTGAK